jgi:quercetin dioxygenase-like cupin family protein
LTCLVQAKLNEEEERMSFWNLGTLQLEQFRPGIMSKAEIGDSLIMVCMQIDPGKEDSGHEHPFDQCGIVLEGQIEMFVDQERQILSPNACYFIPSGRRHGWKTFDNPVKILDISLRQPRE